MSRTIFFVSAIFIVAGHIGAQRLVPITSQGQAADVIVVATADQIIASGGTQSQNIVLLLKVNQTLKGYTASLSPAVTVPALCQRDPGPISFPSSLLGEAGLWFLKSTPNGYQILPRKTYSYTPQDLFVPLPGGTQAAAGAGSLDEQLLADVVASYESLKSPTALDDNLFLSSFEQWSTSSPKPAVVAAAVAPLIASSTPSQQIVGLTAALRVSSPDAMALTLKSFATLKNDPKFPLIIATIAMYPKDATWIPFLQQIAALRSDIPNLDAAVAAALKKIGTKATLPGLVDLLDSKDPQAVLIAESFLGVFTLLADANGEIHDSAPIGPFASDQTRSFTPAPGATSTAVQYAGFWKAWWSQNRARLGFGE